MKVIRCEFAGFCRGVCRAIDRASRLRQTYGTVLTAGELVHNRRLLERLAANRILPLENGNGERTWTGNDPRETACILIRAHGISPQRRRELQTWRLPLFDATCPEVGKIAGLIKRQAAAGFAILIFGDANHAETRGLLGYGGALTMAGESLETLSTFASKYRQSGRSFGPDRVALFSQTTASQDAFFEFCEHFRRTFPRGLIFNTICEATKNRQLELLTFTRQPDIDAIVVVGDRTSSNSTKLARLAADCGKTTFFVQSAQALKLADLAGHRTILLAAGASTCREDIDAVENALKAIPPSGKLKVDDDCRDRPA